jgi:hypothetical protein
MFDEHQTVYHMDGRALTPAAPTRRRFTTNLAPRGRDQR